MSKSILIGLTAILVIVVFFTNFFINKNFLTANLSFSTDFLKINLAKENNSLKLENEDLKSQLQKMQTFYGSQSSNSTSTLSGNYISAEIYSSYPFNIKASITINKGSKDGVKKDMAVLAAENILLGQVSDVADDSATIRTIFDPKWQLPVKIGDNKVNGLFVGGNDPKITLIENPIKIGDAVFINSKDFPIYLKIGDIAAIQQENSGILKESATIKTIYDINGLEMVYLIK